MLQNTFGHEFNTVTGQRPVINLRSIHNVIFIIIRNVWHDIITLRYCVKFVFFFVLSRNWKNSEPFGQHVLPKRKFSSNHVQFFFYTAPRPSVISFYYYFYFFYFLLANKLSRKTNTKFYFNKSLGRRRDTTIRDPFFSIWYIVRDSARYVFNNFTPNRIPFKFATILS